MTPRYRKRKWPAPNLAGHLVYRGVVASWNGLRREARERLSHVSVPQPFQRPIAQLPHPLARHAEHAADLLERVLATAVQAEIQSQHLGVAPLQRASACSISSDRKRSIAWSSVSGRSSAMKRSISERSPSGSSGASSRTSPVLRAARDCTTSSDSLVASEISSGVGPRPRGCRRDSAA